MRNITRTARNINMRSSKRNAALVPFFESKGNTYDKEAFSNTRLLAATILTTGTIYAGKTVLTNYLESHLFKPKDRNHKPLESPDKYGLDGEVKKLRTEDGDTIEIWHLKGQNGKPSVVFKHGNTGNLSYVSQDPKHQEENTAFRIEYLKKLQARGVEAIAVSSRGFGNSTGTPSEANFKRDAKAVADYLQQQGISAEDTIITGESLGTSTATILAEEMTSRGTPPAGLTLIAPFSSMRQQILESSAAPTFLVDMVLDHPLDTDKRLAHIANTAKEKGLIPPHLLVISPSNDAIIHPRHGDDLIKTAKANDIPCMQQHQEASHVNWDADEVIDASLELHEKQTKSFTWKERIAKSVGYSNTPPQNISRAN